MLKKGLRIAGWILLACLAWFGVSVWRNWDTIQRVFLGGLHGHERVPPTIPASVGHPALLVFTKTNAFRHDEAIRAANAFFAQAAAARGWGLFITENGAVFSPALLERFDAVVFSNTSGDVLDPAQQAAMQGFLEKGGGFVGIHAAGDNSHEGWPWYVDRVIGARFIGHPLNPQIQQATVRIEDSRHPATRGLASPWLRSDEWYSFEHSPRPVPGLTVLAALDERSYRPQGWMGQHLAMGDHPIMWWRCVGHGRVFYSAMGHTAESFREPAYQAVLTNAAAWAMRRDSTDDCPAPARSR